MESTGDFQDRIDELQSELSHLRSEMQRSGTSKLAAKRHLGSRVKGNLFPNRNRWRSATRHRRSAGRLREYPRFQRRNTCLLPKRSRSRSRHRYQLEGQA